MESEDIPKIPRAIIEMLAKFIWVYSVQRFFKKKIILSGITIDFDINFKSSSWFQQVHNGIIKH